MLKKYAKPYPTIGEIIAAKDFDYVLIVDMTKSETFHRQPAIILMASFAAALR